jgi:hypothetical protein
MHGAEVLIPLSFLLGVPAMIFGIVYMNKKENLAMIEKGLNPKEWANRPAPYKNLKWGLLMVGAGIGLLIAYLLDVFALRKVDGDPAGVYFALIAIGGGLGLISSYRIEKKELLDRNRQS